jgi:hypothetical protein
MTAVHTAPRRNWSAVLKVLYLFAVTAAVFAVPAAEPTWPARWVVVPALLLLQVVILWWCDAPPRDIFRSAARLRWLFLLLAACYAFLPAEGGPSGSDDWRAVPVPFTSLSVGVNLGGLALAGLMCLQLLTVLFA